MIRSIYCIGRNYKLHAEELGNRVMEKPIVFLKSLTSLRTFKCSEIAFSDETFHYEGEIVLMIGKDHNLNELISKESLSHIAVGIDLTRRLEQAELKAKGLPWTTSKSFLGSSLVGEFHSVEKFRDLSFLEFEFYLNNDLKQKGNSKDMIFSFEYIINYLNSFSPLKKGDIVFTGTPHGVGEISKGDHFKFIIPEINFTEVGQL